ncbi:ATP-grasp domain-containing protein [Lysinibacillus macroides]|nr:ATP-grasp domain-containing protein [Lysinibacillus macroides]
MGEYQQSLDCMNEAVNLSKKIKIDAVMPGREYAVSCVNEIAKKLNLPRLGDTAAKCLTNKFELRKKGEEIGIPQPLYQKISSLTELESAKMQFPYVLKPSNRQASVGVVKVKKTSEIKETWNKTINASEKGVLVTDRSFNWEYQIEEFLEGYEISVETFVRKGEVVFQNVTNKITTSSDYFVELGHTVPATINEETRERLIELKKYLAKGLEVSDGILHSEWIVTKEGPKLIECAGRAPGDNITDLISEAYHFNFFEAYLSILIGKDDTDITHHAKFWAAIRFFNPGSGELKYVKGLDFLKKLPNIIKYDISVEPGQKLSEITSSWDRIGFYMVQGDSVNEVEEIIKKIEKNIQFKLV